MTYNVLGGTINLAQSIDRQENDSQKYNKWHAHCTDNGCKWYDDNDDDDHLLAFTPWHWHKADTDHYLPHHSFT